jgi:hypothetical protein
VFLLLLAGIGAYVVTRPTAVASGTATLLYRETPMGLVIPFDLDISASATARSSGYRSR